MSVAPLAALPSISCADIAPAAVSWLWEPFLARGKLSVLDGDPGTGKSLVTIDLAARLSTGSPMPCSEGRTPIASVLLLNAEDDARDTIRARVVAAGADLSRVRVLAAPGLGLERMPLFPADAAALERAIREFGAALVVIDPLMAFLPPALCAHNDQCIRAALNPLAAIAAATGACLLLVRHLRKAGGPSLYRGLGSIGIAGTVRTGLMIGRHPDDPDLRVLTICKTNVGPVDRSLGFRLTGNGATEPPVVNWVGPVEVSSEDLFGGEWPQRSRSKARERAAEWLREYLAGGPRRAPEVVQAARAAGFPERTLERVKATVGVKSVAVKQNGTLEWWWQDPTSPHANDSLPELDPLPPLAPGMWRRLREQLRADRA